MTINMSALPDGYFHCHWCEGGVRYVLKPDGSRDWPSRCPHCGLHPHPAAVDETVGGKVNPAAAKKATRNKQSAPRMKALGTTPVGQPVLGIDPGWRNVGVVLRDGDVPLLASTLVRPEGIEDPVVWMRFVVAEIKVVLVSSCPPGVKMAIESVTAPKGFDRNGKRAPIDPGPILFTGVVLGGLAAEWPDAAIIQPGRNGSQHITNYPPAIVGRRPKTLPGSTGSAGTRAHEQSAYDVAGKGALLLYPKKPLDLRELAAERMAGGPSGISAQSA